MTAVVAVCAVVLACGLAVVVLRRHLTSSDQRLDAVLARLDDHLEAMSQSIAHAMEVVEAHHRALPPLTLDFDELVTSLASEAMARTGADAAVLRVVGPGERPTVASAGPGTGSEALERSFAPPDARSFRAAHVGWTYDPDDASAEARFDSALVVPLTSSSDVSGAVAVYSTRSEAFRQEDAAALHALLDDAAVPLSNARRFAEVESRLHLDPATGVPNRRGYEHELGREVARARRTGRPLSVAIVELSRESEEQRIGEVAELLTTITRRNDIACRRGASELALLLPGTRGSGASTLTNRFLAEARRALSADRSTMTVGIVEWQPDESSEELDDRIDRELDHGRPLVSALDETTNTSTAVASTVHSTLTSSPDLARPLPADVLRRDALDVLARETLAVTRFGRSLAIVALELGGLDDMTERLGRDAADAELSEVAGKLDRSVGNGSVHRLGPDTFALVLPGSSIDDAEALVGTLQSSLDPPHHEEGLILSAGITEFSESDGPSSALGRAEHALWQAKQAGSGTVVVAIPSRRPTPRS